MINPIPKCLASILSLLLLASCAVGPDYQRPSLDTPTQYKELNNWVVAEPSDGADRGAWWSLYHDPVLDKLEQQIDISNQNLKSAEAAWQQAKAIADETRSSLFPTLSINADEARSGTLAAHSKPVTKYDWTAVASWEIDVWGRIRRTLESQEATAEASEADLANARLSSEANLATNYFELRVQDELERLLNDSVLDDQKIMLIVKNQYEAGIAAKSDLLAAENQLHSVMASAINAEVKRRQYEHAIAVLIGKAPSDFTLGPTSYAHTIPAIPISVPSDLLERRPDIAAAERAVASANAEIGVATAAWFPTLSLGASYGGSAPELSKLFEASSALWSMGPSAAATILDAGARSAGVRAARAGYDQSVANYRETVLTAFQQVEDELAALKFLSDQSKVEKLAVSEAEEGEKLTLNQYKEGVVPYNNVLTAQITTLANKQTELTISSARLVASVALIEALGGDWHTAPQTNASKILPNAMQPTDNPPNQNNLSGANNTSEPTPPLLHGAP